MARPQKRRDGDDRDAKDELSFRVVVADEGPPIDIAGARALLVRLAVRAWRRRSRSEQRIEQHPDPSKVGIGHDPRHAATERGKTA